jgi:hypothetical protein
MLDVVSQIFESLGTAQDHQVAKDAVGGFWSLTVPKTKALIPQLIDYARNGGIAFNKLGVSGFGRLAHLQHDGNTLNALVQFWPGQTTAEGSFKEFSLPIPYPNLAVQYLCQGQPAEFGSIRVQIPTSALLPTLNFDKISQSLTVRFNGSISITKIAQGGIFRKLRERLGSFRIGAMTITPETGEFLDTNFTGGLLPTLVWS